MLATFAQSVPTPPPPPPSGGTHVSVGVGPFGLILIAVLGYVVYRALQARREGTSPARAAGEALMTAAPPAIAAGVGMVILYIGLMMLMMMLVPMLMFGIIYAVFGGFIAALGGHPASIGPFDGLTGPAFFTMLIGMLFLFAAAVYVMVLSGRRLRSRRAVPAPPAAVSAPGASSITHEGGTFS